jgi:LAO/AO transport system kinase
VALTEGDQADVEKLTSDVFAGTRRGLARAITLVESDSDAHQEKAAALLEAILPKAGGAVRVGISGVPGVGKSTFIEALGLDLIKAGHRVAVLAVDPTSPKSGGSILGDKTRMEKLGQEEGAFIRPSPSGLHLGGVARRTREALLLCEAAGYDVILVETVGVGQSEAEVASMVDTFVLLLLPSGGDELQGVKRGVLELCDVVAVNKTDGDLEATAMATATDYRRALHLLRGEENGWRVVVRNVSAAMGQGIDTLWQDVLGHQRALKDTGALAKKRQDQAETWMWKVVDHELARRFKDDPRVASDLGARVDAVRRGQEAPTRAAQRLLDRFLTRS